MAEEAEGSQEAVSAEDPVVDRRAVREALTVRRPEPGDRIRLRAGRRKLSDLFIDLKEDMGCIGPCVGCVTGCAKYWLTCLGCRRLLCGRKSSKKVVLEDHPAARIV